MAEQVTTGFVVVVTCDGVGNDLVFAALPCDLRSEHRVSALLFVGYGFANVV